MRCHKPFDLCPECPRKWLVQPDTPDGKQEFFCFDTEEEARACYEQIERTNEYEGLHFKPKSAILFKPEPGVRGT